MGVVYSSLEISQGAIPSHGAHIEAAGSVLAEVSCIEGSVLTVVHGSVAEGRHNTRSDLDVLVTYDAKPINEPAIVRQINAALGAIALDTHVKIEANVWPSDESPLARKERMYDLLFSRHLAKSIQNDVWSRGEADQSILEIAQSSYGADLVGVALNYVTYKHAGFTKAPLEYADTEKVLSSFQRALEFPKSVGRKVEQLFGRDRDASLEEYWDSLVNSGLTGESFEALRELHDIDAEYTDLVTESAGAGAPDEAQVNDYTMWLRSRYPRAIDLGMIAASGFSTFVASTAAD